MKTIYFLIQGQFGNNLFQYYAAEILKKIYPSYEEIKPTFQINLEFNNVIDDEKFKAIITKHINGEKYELDTRRDILLMGFFQRSEIYKFEREYLRSLFNESNMNNISNRIKIGNIVKYQSKHTVAPTEADLTLHIRCGDFWDHAKNRSQIYHPEFLKRIIRSIKYDKLYIVCNKPEFDWEREYYKEFDELSPIWVNGNLGDDFDFLMKSKTLITSASTMAWMAAFLGQGNQFHIPYNTYYGGFEGYEQSLAEFDDEKCKMYYDVEYWMPTPKSS
jgi:hypothetical protein